MNVLFIGAHPDDIELGAAVAIQWHLRRGDNVFCVAANTGSSDGEYNWIRAKEQINGLEVLGVPDTNVKVYYFTMEELAEQYRMIPIVRGWMKDAGNADIVYTHFPNDTHRDHVYLAQAVIPAARMCQAILFFETPSTQQFTPTLYLPADDGMDQKKIAAIGKHVTQVTRHACDLNLLDWANGLMRHRGYEFRAAGPVEAYAVSKMNGSIWLAGGQA